MAKIGYCFNFNLRNKKNEINFLLLVNIVLDYERDFDTIKEYPLSKFVKSYIDLEEETIKFEIIENPYFSTVSVQSYELSQIDCDEFKPIKKEEYEQKLKEYITDVKNNGVYFEKTGESIAYFYV